MAERVNIDLEGGTLDPFDSTIIDSGDLSVETAAALAGTGFGLQCVIDDTNEIRGQKNFTQLTSDNARFRFYIDPNGITSSGNDWFGICSVEQGTSRNYLLSLNVRAAGGWQFQLAMVDDSGSTKTAQTADVTDEPHIIEARFTRATTDSANDGSAEIWIDGVSAGTISNVDLFDRSQPDNVKFGAGVSSDISAGTAGTIWLDQLILRDDDEEIGEHVVEPLIGLASVRDAVAIAAASADAAAVDAVARDVGE